MDYDSHQQLAWEKIRRISMKHSLLKELANGETRRQRLERRSDPGCI